MRRDLWGEITESPEEMILRLAQRAVEEMGYATYSEFGEFIQPLVRKADPSSAGRVEQEAERVIRKVLKKHRWRRRIEERNKVVFYPPDSRLPEDDQLELRT